MELLEILLSASFWAAAIRIASPLIFATMGELICERAGVLNLGIEGIMVAGAFAGWIAVWAGLLVLLDAGFLAVVQVFIYAGAISILLIFAVMVTRRVMNPEIPPRNTQWTWALGLALVGFVILLLTLWPNPIELPVSGVTLGGISWPEADEDTPVVGVEELGEALVDSEQYAVPFEVASVLLLVAMIGAVYVVFPRREAAAEEVDDVDIQLEEAQ